MKQIIRHTMSAAAVAVLATGVQAGVFPQCPTGGVATTDAFAPGVAPNAKICRHLAASDGFALRADGTDLAPLRYYTFGFSEMTGVPNDQVMNRGIFNAKWSAPTIALREGQEMYLALTNVGMLLRPDLFDPHSVHFHGFTQAAPIYDGVPDASAVVNTGSTFTYYYKLNDPGTYIYHCHVESTEHMHMGMLGTLYVRPKQDLLPNTTFANGFVHVSGTNKYTYNDGDGSTRYDVDFPLQLGAFDGVFHDLHEAVQPLPFHEMKATHTFINGRGYPHTVFPGALPPIQDVIDVHGAAAESSQVVPALVTAQKGQRILLRLSNSSVSEYFTVTALGLPMRLVGQGAAITRGPTDTAGGVTGRDWTHDTGSLTLGGGEIVDVIVDTASVEPGTYFLYTTNLNYLSNGSQDRGGIMTHIVINP